MAALQAIFVALFILAVATLYSHVAELEIDTPDAPKTPTQQHGKCLQLICFLAIFLLTVDEPLYLFGICQKGVAEKDVSQSQDAFSGVSIHDHLLTQESGSFESPNFPLADHRLDCLWYIRVAPSNVVRIDFVDFDTEHDHDYIFVSATDQLILLTSSFRNRKFA